MVPAYLFTLVILRSLNFVLKRSLAHPERSEALPCLDIALLTMADTICELGSRTPTRMRFTVLQLVVYERHTLKNHVKRGTAVTLERKRIPVRF